MAEPTPPVPQPSPAANPQPQKKRRRWLRVALLCLVLLISGGVVLVALAPTIINSKAARGLVLSQVNQRFLNGKIEVADWRFGWLSGQQLSGIRVYDDKQSLVAEVAQVTLDKTLWSALADPNNLGRVKIDRPNLNAREHADGSLNVSHVTKPDDAGVTDPQRDYGGSTIEIASLTGDIEIVNGIVTYSGRPGVPTVALARINGHVRLPGGDAPIENKLDLIASVDDGPGGTVAVAGNLALFKDGKLVISPDGVPDLTHMAAQQTLTYADVALSVVNPLLGDGAPISAVQGKAAGTSTATLSGRNQLVVTGRSTIAGLAATGPALKGDTFASETTELIVPTIAIAMPNGPQDLNGMRIKVGESAEQPVVLSVQQGRATAFIDASVASIMNAVDGKAPGAAGHAIVEANFDIGKLAGGLRNTFKLIEGVELTGGTLASRSTLNITPEAIEIASNTSLASVAGRDARKDKAIALQPIKIDLAATAGGSANRFASVRDVKFDLASAFANGSFAGPSLAGLNGKLNGALDKVQAELGQIVDFGSMKLFGTFDVDVATRGDLAAASTTPVVVDGGLTVRDLRIEGLPEHLPIVQQQIVGRLVADVATDAATAMPRAVNVTTATLRTGDLASPTVSADATASLTMVGETIEVPAFAVTQFAVDLPRLARELGTIFPQLQQASDAVGGAVTASIVGAVSGPATEPRITLSSLDARHSGNLFSASLAEPITVTLPANAPVPHATGTLAVTADLAGLNRAARLFMGGKELVASGAGGDVRTGTITGTVALSRPDATHLGVNANFVTADLAVATANGVQNFQPITLKLLATAADDLSGVTIQSASADGDLVDARANDVQLMLNDAAGPGAAIDPLKAIVSGDVSLAIPNLSPVYAIASSFLPPPVPAADGTPAEPMKVMGGSFATKATVSRGPAGLPTMNVSELRGERIAVQVGSALYEVASLNGSQTLTPNGQGVSIKGSLPIKGLKLTEDGKVAFAEDQIEIVNDLSIDLSKSDLVINAATLKMASSAALSVTAKGAIRDYGNARRFDNVTADVAYVLEALWPLVKPFVATEPDSPLAELQVSGRVERQFTVGGQLPANLPFNEAIKQLTATGGVAVPSAVWEGNQVVDLDQPVSLANGVLTLGKTGGTLNGGAVNLTGATVDLTDAAAPRLTIPSNTPIVADATLNPYLADKLIGKFINPAFTGAQQAKGLLSVTALAVDRVALDPDLIRGVAKGAPTGSAELSVSIKDLELGGTAIQLIQLADPQARGFGGEINDGRVTLANGVVNSDITLQLKQSQNIYPIRLAGNVGLEKFNLSPFVATIPTQFIQRLGGDLQKYMPATLDIPFGGTSLAPRLLSGDLVGRLVQEATKKAIADNLIKELTKSAEGKGDTSGDSATKKPPESPEDAIGEAIEDLFKKRKKK